METFLKIKTGAPGEYIYTADEIATVYDSFGIQEEFVEKLSPGRARPLTPAEDPDQYFWQEGRLFARGHPLASLADDDIDDEDDDDIDIDEELDDVDVEDDEVVDVSDDDLDDDLDLNIDDDEDDDDLV
jgi:hypothetical protein